MPPHAFRGKVHIGCLAAIVAASNAAGSGSVVDDTTTTLIWISGISPLTVPSSVLDTIALTTLVIGFLVMLAILGWNPDPPHVKRAELPAPSASTTMGNPA